MYNRSFPIFVAVFPAIFLPSGAALATTAVDEDDTSMYVDCPLERIGTQLVRCDNLTGAGVEAPFWIPEQK